MNNRSFFKTFLKFRHVLTEIALIVSMCLLFTSVMIVTRAQSLRVCSEQPLSATSTRVALIEEVRPHILKTLLKPDSAVFDEPVFNESDIFIKINGHFTTMPKYGATPVDMIYTAAFMRLSQKDWKLVHLDVNGDVLIHTLP